jgi:hypothetical protein
VASILLLERIYNLNSYRQGCYSNDGDIVVCCVHRYSFYLINTCSKVLCAYLGQLARLRDALASEVAVVIDERDQDALVRQEDDSDENVKQVQLDATIERISVSKRVRQFEATQNQVTHVQVRLE